MVSNSVQVELESLFVSVLRRSGWSSSRQCDFGAFGWDPLLAVDWTTPVGALVHEILTQCGGLFLPQCTANVSGTEFVSVAMRFPGAFEPRLDVRGRPEWWRRMLMPFGEMVPYPIVPIAMSFDRHGGDIDNVIFVSRDSVEVRLLAGNLYDPTLLEYRGDSWLRLLCRCYFCLDARYIC